MLVANLIQMGKVLFFIGLLSLPLFFGWDQLALQFKWPRPTWLGAGGTLYIAMLANLLWNTRFTIGSFIQQEAEVADTPTPTNNGTTEA